MNLLSKLNSRKPSGELKQSGFMLVGMIAAVGIISLIGGVIATSVFVFAESNTSNQEHNRVSQEVTKINTWFSRDVRKHVSSDLLDGVPANSATFSLSSGVGTTMDCSYDLVGDEIIRTCDGIEQVIGRNVTSLEFVKSGDAVNVSFEVESPVRNDVAMDESVSLRSDISSSLARAMGMQDALHAGSSCPIPGIDFETDGFGSALGLGTVIDDEWAIDGIHVSVEGAGGRTAMIFDSSAPTGGDKDLGTPHVDFAGPGTGAGGASGQTGENNAALGNILIISEDGDSSDPDDNAGGGTIVFKFDSPSSIASIGFMDLEESLGTVETLNGLGETIDIHNFEALGDNSVETMIVGDHGVSELRINLPGSGAVTEITFSCGS